MLLTAAITIVILRSMALNSTQLVPGLEFTTGPEWRFTILREYRASNRRVYFSIRRADGSEYQVSRVSLLRDRNANAVPK